MHIVTLCAMLSNGDKQEDASNAMENIFGHVQITSSAIHPDEQNLRRARNSWKHYANDNGLSVSADQGQRRHSGNIFTRYHSHTGWE